MDTLYAIFIVIHMIGWAMVLGGVIVNMKEDKLNKGVLHGALTALVAGIVLVGLAEMGDGSVNHMKIGIKLLVTLVVVALTMVGTRNPEKVTKGTMGAIAGLTVVNIALAVMW